MRILVLLLCFYFSSTIYGYDFNITNYAIDDDTYCLNYNNPDGDGVFLFIDIIQTTTSVVITPIDYSVGIPFAWYSNPIATANDITNYIPFATNFGTLLPIEINKFNEFYLYSWSGNNYDTFSQKPILSILDSVVYGQFIFNDSQLQVVSSSVVNLPEPSVNILLLVGISMILCRNYRSRAVNP